MRISSASLTKFSTAISELEKSRILKLRSESICFTNATCSSYAIWIVLSMMGSGSSHLAIITESKNTGARSSDLALSYLITSY